MPNALPIAAANSARVQDRLLGAGEFGHTGVVALTGTRVGWGEGVNDSASANAHSRRLMSQARDATTHAPMTNVMSGLLPGWVREA